METRKRTVELDELRLREVAINSALAKSGKQIRVKAVEVNKNNVVRIGFKIGEKDAKAVMNYYPDALFMDCDDALVAERFAIMYEKYMEQFRSYNSKPSKEDFMDNLFPNLLGAANARWLNEEGRACREVLDMAETLFCVLAPNTFMHQGEQLLLQVSDIHDAIIAHVSTKFTTNTFRLRKTQKQTALNGRSARILVAAGR